MLQPRGHGGCAEWGLSWGKGVKPLGSFPVLGFLGWGVFTAEELPKHPASLG